MRGVRVLCLLSGFGLFAGVVAAPASAAWPSSYWPTYELSNVVGKFVPDDPTSCRDSNPGSMHVWNDSDFDHFGDADELGEPTFVVAGDLKVSVKGRDPRVVGFTTDPGTTITFSRSPVVHNGFYIDDIIIGVASGKGACTFADEIWFARNSGRVTNIFTDGFESGAVVRITSVSGDVDPESPLSSGRQQGTLTGLELGGDPVIGFFDVFFDITLVDKTSAGCTVKVNHLSFMVEIDGVNFRVEFSPGPPVDSVVQAPGCSSFSLNFEEIKALLLPAVQ